MIKAAAADLLERVLADAPLVAATVQAAARTAAAIQAGGTHFTFAEVFTRQLAALARPGDVLWALSTSGRSPNILRALDVAGSRGLHRVLITGARGRHLNTLAESVLAVPSDETPRVQEVHLMLGHFLCEAVEAIAGSA